MIFVKREEIQLSEEEKLARKKFIEEMKG
jgi:hypothetical protein